MLCLLMYNQFDCCTEDKKRVQRGYFSADIDSVKGVLAYCQGMFEEMYGKVDGITHEESSHRQRTNQGIVDKVRR